MEMFKKNISKEKKSHDKTVIHFKENMNYFYLLLDKALSAKHPK